MASVKKSGSKNNVANRGEKVVKHYNSKVVHPVQLISQGRKIIAAQYEDKKLVLDPSGQIITYSSIQ